MTTQPATIEKTIADALVPSGSDALDSRQGTLARNMVADRIVQALYAAGYRIERVDRPDTTRTRLTANILTALADENTRLRAAGQQLADALSGPTWHFHDPYTGPPRIEDCDACAALQGWEDATGEQTPT